MFKLLVFFLCLLLCGCAENAPSPEPTAAAEPARMAEIQTSLESHYSGALEACPVAVENIRQMYRVKDGLLFLSGKDGTTLTLLSADALSEIASRTLDFQLDASQLQIRDGYIACFNANTKELLVLNHMLEELQRIPSPDGLVGIPQLCSDGSHYYYCTSNAIRSWDLTSGIRRRIKEMPCNEETLSDLVLSDRIILCREQDGHTQRTLFLDAETGALQYQQDSAVTFLTDGNRYWAAIPTGPMQTLVFGTAGTTPQTLLPEDLSAPCTFLPSRNAAVTLSSLADGSHALNCYDLNTGRKTAQLTLDPRHVPKAIAEGDGNRIALLVYDPDFDAEVVLQWETKPATASSQIYTDNYYTADSPDHLGLSRCQRYAEELSDEYGIRIQIWKDATVVQPWDYDLEPEHLYRVTMENLLLLDRCLAQYPQEVLTQTAAHFSSLNICLVRQITGSAASGSLEAATGVQFLNGTDAYVVIAAGNYAEQALYHELFHVMETHILSGSTALDCWDELNPSGFSYDYSLSNNASRDSGVYLQTEHRAFVDTYSMSFPREDRARILEYAMLSGHDDLFQTDIMQAKLKAICTGIRESYGLKKSPDSFPWEQYLEKSMAYNG